MKEKLQADPYCLAREILSGLWKSKIPDLQYSFVGTAVMYAMQLAEASITKEGRLFFSIGPPIPSGIVARRELRAMRLHTVAIPFDKMLRHFFCGLAVGALYEGHTEEVDEFLEVSLGFNAGTRENREALMISLWQVLVLGRMPWLRVQSGELYAYLFVAVLNELKRYQRDLDLEGDIREPWIKKHLVVASDSDLEESNETIQDRSKTPEEVLIANDLLSKRKDLLFKLATPSQFEILNHFFNSGQPELHEIASALGISPDTVWVQNFRLKQEVKKVLKKTSGL